MYRAQALSERQPLRAGERSLEAVWAAEERVQNPGEAMPARPESAASGQQRRHDRWSAMFVKEGWDGDGDLVKASAPQLEEIGGAISAVKAINGSVGIGANGQKRNLCDI